MLGIDACVEARGSLALVTFASPPRRIEEHERVALLACAQEFGFTHIALELVENDGGEADALVHRD